MEWTRTETLALAQQSCTYCHGLGLKSGRGGAATPCKCVFRAIFRACYSRFRQCASREKYMSRVSFDSNPGRERRATWGLKNEEFMADFVLISKRILNEAEYRIFKFHFLLGADWKLCCRKLNMDRGSFFHDVYRVQQKLGQAFREVEPYALFPVDEYFNSTPRTRTAALYPVQIDASPAARTRLPFPVKKAA